MRQNSHESFCSVSAILIATAETYIISNNVVPCSLYNYRMGYLKWTSQMILVVIYAHTLHRIWWTFGGCGP